MQLVLSFKVIKSDELDVQLDKAFSLGYPLQLQFGCLADYEDNIDKIADVLSENSQRVISIKGPLVPSKRNTLFEDTVLIATQLEDFFDINLKFISTFYSNSYKHIEELIDFYGDLKIHVEGIVSDPISTMSLIAESNTLNKFERVTGLVYNINSLSGVWLTEEIILALKECIFEFNYRAYHRQPGIPQYRLLDSSLLQLFKQHCPNTVFTVEFVSGNYTSNLPEIAQAMSSFLDGYTPSPSYDVTPLIDSLLSNSIQEKVQ